MISSQRTLSTPVAPTAFEPTLKQSTDPQLESAFYQHQWSTAANLAKTRFAKTKDTYYQAIEVAARSRGELAADRYAGLELVQRLVAANATPKDVESVDLYDFACAELDVDYPATVGVLRLRLVKAMPKDPWVCLRCFEGCIWNSDWEHAQQIAASMDRNFPHERKYLYRNVLTTFMYTLTPVCPPEKASMFQRLAKMTIDKAYGSRIQSPVGEKLPERAVQTEEELWLWQRLLFQGVSEKGRLVEILGTLKKTDLGVFTFLQNGSDLVFLEILAKLKDAGAWEEIFSISQDLINKVISLAHEEASQIERAESSGEEIPKLKAKRSAEHQVMFLLAANWTVWQLLISAAAEKPDSSQELSEVGKLLDTLVRSMQRARDIRNIHKKNLDIALLQILFEKGPESTETGGSDDDARAPRVFSYVQKHYKTVGCFQDVKRFASDLYSSEARELIDLLKAAASEGTDTFKQSMITALRLKFEFLFSTGLGGMGACLLCKAKLRPQSSDCSPCLRSILDTALENYNTVFADKDIRQEVLPKQDVDPLTDFTLVGSMCLLTLARVGRQWKVQSANSPLTTANAHYFLQAVAWLESYCNAAIKNDPLRMLLVKMYLLMGCVSEAKELWGAFDVKNAILDSMAGLFFDRLSTISPKYAQRGSRSNPSVAQETTSFLDHAIRRVSPKQIRLAFECDNYSTIEDLYMANEKHKSSCTLVMATIEERRAARFKAGRNDFYVDSDPLIRNITTRHTLSDHTTYGFLPHFGHSDSTPIQSVVHNGPAFTNTRAQLSLLAERFIDLMSLPAVKDYKPVKAGVVHKLDLLVVAEEAGELSLQMTDLIMDATSSSSLTGCEQQYFELLTELAALCCDLTQDYLLSQGSGSAKIKAKIEIQIKEVQSRLESQVRDVTISINEHPANIRPFYGFAALHSLGMLHESALALKLCAVSLATLHERHSKSSSSGSGGDAWLSAQLKTLASSASDADNKAVRPNLKRLKDFTHGSGWVDTISSWTFDISDASTANGTSSPEAEREQRIANMVRQVVGGRAPMEKWAGKLIESWRDAIDGWNSVKLVD